MTRTGFRQADVRPSPRFTFAGRGCRDPRREPRRRPAAVPPGAVSDPMKTKQE